MVSGCNHGVDGRRTRNPHTRPRPGLLSWVGVFRVGSAHFPGRQSPPAFSLRGLSFRVSEHVCGVSPTGPYVGGRAMPSSEEVPRLGEPWTSAINDDLKFWIASFWRL